MYSLILHGKRSIKLQKWLSLSVSIQIAFYFSRSFSSASARDGLSFKEKSNPDSVLNLLRSYEFTDSQISGIVTNYPRLLLLDAEKSLGPKLQFLLSVKGASSSELTETVSKIIKADKSSKFEKLCHSLPQGLQDNKIRNVSVLREVGVPQRLLLPSPISDRKLTFGRETFQESLKKVVEMGFDPTSSKFVEALSVVQRLSEKAIEEKVNVYKRLGFAVRDVWEMFKNCPNSLRLSERKITQTFESLRICGLVEDEILSVFKKSPECIGYSKKKIFKSILTFLGLGFSKDEFGLMVKRFPPCLNMPAETVKRKTKFLVKKKNKFLVKKMEMATKSRVSYPEVLGYSMEKRIKPRCNVMKALMSKGLLGNRDSKLPDKESVLLCTNQDFLNRFVRNHDDKELVAELMAIFTRDCASWII
ncbi:hypothetical protein EUTSA_v10023801mg [Eutrema salsugineum]|uniref:Mitochondrial transcription termination factor family protein n=1 Tax=Eutrema salsugineum TaxID=72664 RepID=V4JV00_EUTSA|nr:hypothetical protein EUTSA_v10023801mg [Eutrema salsugineum]